ncbi:MAG TPA: HU family DNA-binding protein [Candidatus Limnocylindrales bacterium]|nr:HU family DNA-binding protein [Candidatus Limnocylindrales bacterium]
MNKGDLVSRVAEAANLTKAQAAKAIDGTIKGIMSALQKGEKVTLVGFGTFSVAKRKARIGRNPSTGKELKIPAKQVPKFVAGAKLREAATKAKK